MMRKILDEGFSVVLGLLMIGTAWALCEFASLAGFHPTFPDALIYALVFREARRWIKEEGTP